MPGRCGRGCLPRQYPDNSTSSTIPVSGVSGSPRKIERSRSPVAPNSSGQSPVK